MSWHTVLKEDCFKRAKQTFVLHTVEGLQRKGYPFTQKDIDTLTSKIKKASSSGFKRSLREFSKGRNLPDDERLAAIRKEAATEAINEWDKCVERSRDFI
tara:strand:+ start:10781 stop:11080 length:300 start_codon:yes stop_codon:yes gene_type:complete